MARPAVAAALCCACACRLAGATPAQCNTTLSVSALKRELWGAASGYDKDMRPKLAADSRAPSVRDEVFVMLQVFSVLAVDTVHQTFTVEAYVRTIWWDDRLRYAGLDPAGCQEEVSFMPPDLENIWKPDLVFQNGADPATTMFDAWWLYPDGKVWWARKVSITLTCKMDFANLPFDVQQCPVQMLTWRTTSTEVHTRFWDPAVKEPGDMRTGGSVEWDLKGIDTRVEEDNDVWGCSFGCAGLVWTLTLARSSEYYMLYILTPNFFLVALAWSSFFISRSAAPARVALTVICFLTITGQISSVLTSLPKIAGRVWLLRQLEISRCFVFVAILEYAVCNYLGRIEARLKAARTAAMADRNGRNAPVVADLDRRNGDAGDQDENSSQALESGTRSSEALQSRARPSGTSLASHRTTPGPRLSWMAHSIRDIMHKNGHASFNSRLWARKDGIMFVRDEQVDMASRVLFPVAYAAIVGANWVS